VAKAPASFAICLSCHRVNGMENSVAPVGIDAPATAGPNLTNFGCRDTLAAGMLINNKQNVEAWLRDPASVKSGNWMATVIKKGTLTEQQVEELATYLESLKPKGGCATYSGQPVNAPVANPAATPGT
jgi:cytochrome c oxidase subunit 2